MSGQSRGRRGARLSGVAAILLALGGCNPADISIYLSARAIKSGLIETCGDVEGCQEAVETQFDACFEKSGYERLKRPGKHTIYDGTKGECLKRVRVESSELIKILKKPPE